MFEGGRERESKGSLLLRPFGTPPRQTAIRLTEADGGKRKEGGGTAFPNFCRGIKRDKLLHEGEREREREESLALFPYNYYYYY